MIKMQDTMKFLTHDTGVNTRIDNYRARIEAFKKVERANDVEVLELNTSVKKSCFSGTFFTLFSVLLGIIMRLIACKVICAPVRF